jgi:hypothetical protein
MESLDINLRQPRQHYCWSEKALAIVRSTRTPKKDGTLVVEQLQALTGYPKQTCWRLAERYGFRRPNARRVWTQEDIHRVLELADKIPVREIAARFHTTSRTIYLKIYRHQRQVGYHGVIYTASMICNLLKVTHATVRQWGMDGRLKLRQETRGQATASVVDDFEFERFCRDNLTYLIFMVGGRIAPRERIQFLKEFVIAAEQPDDHTARSHRRERKAYEELVSEPARSSAPIAASDQAW